MNQISMANLYQISQNPSQLSAVGLNTTLYSTNKENYTLSLLPHGTG